MNKKLNRDLLNLQARHERGEDSGESRSILALDYGEKFIGLAFSPDGSTILPIGVIKTNESVWKNLEKVLVDKKIELLVLGLPLGINGEENHICKVIRKFSTQLQHRFNLPFKLVNERYSSQQSLVLDQTERRDDLAAMNILEYFLSQKGTD